MKSLYQECIGLGPEEDSEDAVYVFAESALYILGATGAFDFQKHIRNQCKNRSAKSFRLRLCEHRYTNLNLKLYLIHLVLEKASSSRAKKLAEQYNITKRDAWLTWRLLTENTWFRKEAVRYVKSLGCSVQDLDTGYIHQIFNQAYPSVLKYIKHITYNKLRFLAKSTNTPLSDFHSELSTKLVQSFYSLVPIRMGEAHLVNYLKRSVHNHAVNIIKSGTTKKRARLISTEADANGNRQFSMLCLSQNQMALTETGELADVDGQDDSADKFELQFSITEVLDGIKMHARKYRFLTLLLGAEDKEFSQFLRKKGICGDEEDNVDVQHKVESNHYTRLVSDFLRVPKERVQGFFDSLRHQLAWG